MDRLNQLRGDAGASRDSTLDTSSLMGEAYMTANESSKYFSLSEIDSSSSAFPSKEAGDDVTGDNSIPHTERIISNLSPIPKNNELTDFKIGEQIEAANILSGGVNIFDDNENSYDGDELVIDDALADGDDKPIEMKLTENADVTFEKTDRLADTSMEDTEAAIASKDTEVVLQIDGNNVDAIDIGNGLYLYRKDGEEELAAVQILDDNQQQPDIKFLKVRENAEGNLEVYEEIEIEVPKEVPTKEGKVVKNSSHDLVQDLNKETESLSNKVAVNESQAVPKDAIVSEVELDLNKDNAHIESRTEVNLNGKMMKFSESRKSPLIGTFTPMTYHSTPNKEGIPLTKTMVDLQLHPNRHSENVKKTIEVHTDNCKQRLLDPPSKGTKDANIEYTKNTELVSASLDKNDTNHIAVDGTDKITLENNKDVNRVLIENKTNKVMTMKFSEDQKSHDNKFKNPDNNLLAKDNFVKEDKTETSDVKIPIALEKPLVAQGEVNIKSVQERDTVKVVMVKTGNNSTSNKTCNEINKTCDEIKDGLQTNIAQEKYNECSELEGIKANDDIIMGNCSVVKERVNEDGSSGKDKDIVESKEKNTDNVMAENLKISDVTMSNIIVSTTDDSKNPLKTTQNICNNSTERQGSLKETQNVHELEDISLVKQVENNTLQGLEPSSKLNALQEMPQIHRPVETLDISTQYATSVEMNDSASQSLQKVKSPPDDKMKPNTVSELTALEQASEIHEDIKFAQGKSGMVLKNFGDPVKSPDSLLSQPAPSFSMLNNLSKEDKLKKDHDLKQQKNECKIHLSGAGEINSYTNLNPPNHNSNLLGTDNHSSKNIKTDDVTVVTKMENDEKKQPDRLFKVVVNKIDPKFSPLEIVSSKMVTDASKHVANTEFKSLHKDSLTMDQNCTRNSSLVMKSSTTEKGETQKKNESNPKLPILYKNTNISSNTKPIQNVLTEVEKGKNDVKKETAKVNKAPVPKPINNNKAAVPFGKWTEANRQEFLNKIKESKVPINTSNTKQLKQPNDLNRRDILKKIDSQRQSNIASTKVQELNVLNKIKLKQEAAAFVNKSNISQKEKFKDNKGLPPILKPAESTSITPIENAIALSKKVNTEHPQPIIPIDMPSSALCTKKDSVHRKEINNQDLIDKTIEGIINRAVTSKSGPEEVKQDNETVDKSQNLTPYTSVSLDEIESKMNELHGIPFIERPPHELPKVFEHENKTVVTPDASLVCKSSKLTNAVSYTNKVQQKNEHKVNQSIMTRVTEESDEEIIEHEPVTGDIELNKSNLLVHGPVQDKIQSQELVTTKVNYDTKRAPIITENDFDKFARRNSITYENCLTVNFDGKELHNVVQTVVEREAVPKKLSRNEIMLAESKAKSHKQLAVRQINFPSKIPTTVKTTQDEDSYHKNYQSKVQIAYQSVMTAKRQQECPITIIEDKPVKVVFMEGNQEYMPHQLNVQGKELSPPKKSITEWDHFTHSNSESLDSDILDVSNDSKSQEDIKFKSKHQRKQVLTPVEAPELELIEPKDLGIEVSPKKKRKVEENRAERYSKSLVPKKSYLLNRNTTTSDAPSNSQDTTKITLQDSDKQQDVFVKQLDPISAIDNLVKAAELLETQSESKNILPHTEQNSLTQETNPVKRGRGRPRKYPLPDSGSDKSPSPVKTPTPQKKPRLIDSKIPKPDTESEDDEVNSDGELVKENWTMGKINENIVCPICNKLFRSENVVFKHVKHCTGPSPSRSDSDKRSPIRMRQSQELDWKSEGSKSDSLDIDEDYEMNKPSKTRKSKEKRSSIEDKTDVIIIEDTPVRDRDSPIRKRERLKHEPNKNLVKANAPYGPSGLVCEFCGKTFRQLSYLVSHRLQHKNTETKKSEKDQVHKSLFSCEFCKKEFRKLHHLVQHRFIHNSNPTSSSRKSSSEHNDNKTAHDAPKATEDQSAGFRCEPCDKSFRKLHHLVEHRETHDEMNKKCNPATSTIVDTPKLNPLHHCDICKKTFKKLQHLIEHKEHHLDTSSEKSDDKSVKSSLSTKDIIHECPLCYMVFPNEHSLNKHHVICQRKKKQSAVKQAKQIDEIESVDVDEENKITEVGDVTLAMVEHKTDAVSPCVMIEDRSPVVTDKQETNIIQVAKPLETKKVEIDNDIKPTELDQPPKADMDVKTQINDKHPKFTNQKKHEYERNADKVSAKPKKCAIPTTSTVEIKKIPNTTMPKNKLLTKDKIGATVTKRQKTINVSLPEKVEVKPGDSSDDDEIRYMLNPDLLIEESNEGKQFMKVRAKKRNSLQIERPDSKDLMKRRISLQHPPKIPRLKVKQIPRKPINTNAAVKSSRITIVPVEPPPATDSDDSDVKYSFPEPVMKEMAKEGLKKVKKQKLVEKRKSLNNIAKRKSLGKIISVKQKINPSPPKQIKKRSADAEHRCDCGQLFSSAALLMRHTSLAHTPPRIRRRRSPPPDNDTKPIVKRTEKPQETRKTIEPITNKIGVTTRKSSINSEVKTSPDNRKTPKNTSLAKTRRSTAHKGVPVPEKMRKLMDRSRK